MTIQTDSPKILVWDIESTTLNATFGTILCIGYKWLGQKKVYCPTLRDYEQSKPWDDSGLVAAFSAAYELADYTVTHYGKKFDLPMVQTKCLEYGLGPLPPIPMVDNWKTMYDNFKFHSNRLQVLLEFLRTEAEKTPIDMEHWKGALFDDKHLRYVVKHCKADVEGLAEAYEIVRPWAREPNRALFGPVEDGSCVSCGSTKLQPRGYHYGRVLTYRRFRCGDCGKWQRDKKPLGKSKITLQGSY